MTVKPHVSDHHRAAILQELWLGPSVHMGSVFGDRQGLEEAWREYGPEVMAMHARDGLRPQGWWEFDCPAELRLRYDGGDHERSILWRAGILTGEERRDVEQSWRCEFEKAVALGYNAKRRRKYYAWADIPDELIRAWSRERRRNGKTIRKLEAETNAPVTAPLR